MRTNVRKTVQLGELIVAVFDIAAQYSTDPREISRLATGVVMHTLRRAWMTLPPPSIPAICFEASAVS
ncbi:MAG: hypothetical protein ACYSUI_24800 [Planctomycetota bacterium]|jgi:hypothetical protein